ncbi:MAG: hypothetical protein ACK4EY_14485 [Flavipsychrobacter sp.]
MEKNKIRNTEQAAIVHKVARLAGVSKRQVYRVINGEQINEKIMTAYMELLEGEASLLEAVKKAVPFD